MRDLAIFAIVFGTLPFVFTRPWLGVLLWTWMGIMNPHRLAWGYAANFPFAFIIAIATLISLFTSKDKKTFPLSAEIVLLLLFIFWIVFTTFFALYPDLAWTYLARVVKIQLFILITLMVMHDRRHLELLIWVATLSIAFYGVKGGLYTFTQSGDGMVLGPPSSFIEGNTEIGLAIVISIPLLLYLHSTAQRRWVRWTMVAAMILSALAAVGSYSRGAFLAVAAMAFFLWFKTRQKVVTGMLLVLLAPAVFYFMPEAWHTRMDTIGSYQQDESAQGRLNAWQFAYHLANDHPLVGGGFQAFQKEAFQRWAPDPLSVHDAHSIWFQVLGEHGYVGLALFLLMWFFSWRSASAIIRSTKGRKDLDWANHLARSIQVAYIGYFVGGSFLGLAYWDYPYILLTILTLAQRLVKLELAKVTEIPPRPTTFPEKLEVDVPIPLYRPIP